VDTKNNRNKTNNDKSNNNEICRRGFLELGSAAVTGVAGVLAMTGIASAQELVPGVKTGKSTYITDPGLTDKQLDAANPDISVPRPTDAGGVPTFKYPFSSNNRWVYEGGWSREVTVRELPISKTLAGVDMRLTAGRIRELHLGAQQHRPRCDLTLHRLASIQMRLSTGRTLCSNPAQD
jgi:oxalate decarboxylase